MVNKESPEYVLCAAIHYDDRVERVHLPRNLSTGIVVSGWRHPHCFVQLMELYPDRRYVGSGFVTQGFLTSKGNFLDRKEAAALALQTGQIAAPTIRLYSEDIY